MSIVERSAFSLMISMFKKFATVLLFVCLFPLLSYAQTPTVEPAPPEPNPSLELLGESIAPGQSAILNWNLEASFDDVLAPTKVLAVNGANPGPTFCMTAAIHGDELNGIEIIRRVTYELDSEKLNGAVIGVPIVNLEGFRRATRYLPDRRDLNRYFPGRVAGSYASRIAFSFFNQVVKHCDFLVDVHTGSLERTNLPQIRADLSQPRVADLANSMGSIVVLQSRGGNGTLRRAATDNNIPSVTLETGAPNNLQKEAVEQGVKTIFSALRSLGFLAKKSWSRSREPIYYRSRWVRAHEGGILFSKVELGDNVKEGTVLGLLSNPITNKTTEVKSSMEGKVIGMALNQIMYPGFAAYHIGLKSSAVEAAQPEEEALIEGQGLSSTKESGADLILKKAETATIILPTPALEEAPEAVSGEAVPDAKIKPATTIEEMELPTADDAD